MNEGDKGIVYSHEATFFGGSNLRLCGILYAANLIYYMKKYIYYCRSFFPARSRDTSI